VPAVDVVLQDVHVQTAQLRARFDTQLVDQPPPRDAVALEGLGGSSLAQQRLH
jgi:hypothetical protein